MYVTAFELALVRTPLVHLHPVDSSNTFTFKWFTIDLLKVRYVSEPNPWNVTTGQVHRCEAKPRSPTPVRTSPDPIHLECRTCHKTMISRRFLDPLITVLRKNCEFIEKCPMFHASLVWISFGLMHTMSALLIFDALIA